MKNKKYIFLIILLISVFVFRGSFNRYINPDSLGYIALNEYSTAQENSINDLELDIFSRNKIRLLNFVNSFLNLELSFHILLSFIFLLVILISLLIYSHLNYNFFLSFFFIPLFLYLPIFNTSLASIDFEIIFIFLFFMVILLFQTDLSDKKSFYLLLVISFIFTSLFSESFFFLLSIPLYFFLSYFSKIEINKTQIEVFFMYTIFFLWNFLHYFFYSGVELPPVFSEYSFTPIIGFFVVLSLLNIFNNLFKTKNKMFIWLTSVFLVSLSIWISFGTFFQITFILSIILSLNYLDKLSKVKFSSFSRYFYKTSIILISFIIIFSAFSSINFLFNQPEYTHYYYPGYSENYYFSDNSFPFIGYSKNIPSQFLLNEIFEDIGVYDVSFYERFNINSFFIFDSDQYFVNEEKYYLITHNNYNFYFKG